MACSIAALCVVGLFMATLFAGLVWYAGKSSWTGSIGSEEFRSAAILTARTTAISTLTASVLALGCAYALARLDFPLKRLMESLIDIPIVLPPLAGGVALLILFGPVLGAPLAAAGLRVAFSAAGVVIAQTFVALPFAVRMFREAFAAIDPRYEGIARTLGYGPGKVFLRVTLPMARRGILSGIALAWARTIGEFGATAMLAGVTRMKTETVSAAVFLHMSAGELEDAVVASVMLLAASLSALLVYRVLSEGETRWERP